MRALVRGASVALLAVTLSGCYVYYPEPVPVYSPRPAYTPAPTYYAPAPAYYAPRPAYPPRYYGYSYGPWGAPRFR